eukprot:7082866-Pyramimonas_sp.AAC.1
MFLTWGSSSLSEEDAGEVLWDSLYALTDEASNILCQDATNGASGDPAAKLGDNAYQDILHLPTPGLPGRSDGGHASACSQTGRSIVPGCVSPP